jgi:hypothetical protein
MVFVLLVTYGTIDKFTAAFKDNKLLKSQKTVENKVFLNFLLVEEAGSVQIETYPDPGGPKPYRTLKS